MQYRKAIMADVPAIHDIITQYAGEGLMLRRSMIYLYEAVRDFTVAIDPDTGGVVGVGGLHIMSHDLAEVRSLAVKAGTVKKGVGKGIVETLVKEAQELGITRVFALTYQQGFFEKCGFHVVLKETMPQKVWKECVYCPKFHQCDEIAMIRNLDPSVPTVIEATDEIPLVEMPTWARR